MENNTATRPNKNKPVYKFNSAWKLVHSYEKISDAIKEEHISHYKMMRLITEREHHHGFYFSSFPSLREEKESEPSQGLKPWETEDGMFDIRGWGKACF
jgi:hypothetical protein